MTIKELVHALRILCPSKESKVSLDQIFDFINKKPMSKLDKKAEPTVGMLGARQRVFAAKALTAEAGTQQIELGHDLPKMAAK